MLVYDLLIGKGLRGGGRGKVLVLKHHARLQAELARLKVQKKVSRNEDLLPPAGDSDKGTVDAWNFWKRSEVEFK